MKLWIGNVDTKTKVLFKFDSLETVCVDRRSKKLPKLSHYRYSQTWSYAHTHTCQPPIHILYCIHFVVTKVHITCLVKKLLYKNYNIIIVQLAKPYMTHHYSLSFCSELFWTILYTWLVSVVSLGHRQDYCAGHSTEPENYSKSGVSIPSSIQGATNYDNGFDNPITSEKPCSWPTCNLPGLYPVPFCSWPCIHRDCSKGWSCLEWAHAYIRGQRLRCPCSGRGPALN